MSELVTVVVINSLSYTGTTWLNLVLGSHQHAFALGPPDRVYQMRNAHDGTKACRVHEAACEFWPAFLRDYEPNRNFFIQIAERSGRDVIVTNNPIATGAGVELRHRDIAVKHIHLVRDGRALAASHRRRTAGASFLESVTGFLHPSFSTFYFDPDDTDILCLRYEDLVAEPLGVVQRIGRFIGLDYAPEALRFWEHPHHISAGNQGTILQVKLGQGLDAERFKGSDYYASRFAHMKATGAGVLEDDRWREELTARDRFFLDVFCGADNERFGYTRDTFSLKEVAEFLTELRAVAGSLPAPYRDLAKAGLGAATLAVPATYRGIAELSLRKQLDVNWLGANGLRLSPRQLRRIAAAGGVALSALVAFAFVAGVLI